MPKGGRAPPGPNPQPSHRHNLCSVATSDEWGVSSFSIPGSPETDQIDAIVHPAPAQQMYRRGTARARRNLHFNPFNEPMKVRAHSSRLAYSMSPGSSRLVERPCCVLSAAGRLHDVQAVGGQYSCRARCPPSPPIKGRWRAVFRAAGRCAAAAGPRTRAPTGPSYGPAHASCALFRALRVHCARHGVR